MYEFSSVPLLNRSEGLTKKREEEKNKHLVSIVTAIECSFKDAQYVIVIEQIVQIRTC